MLRRLLVCAITALVAAPTAFADGGSAPPVAPGWEGVSDKGAGVRYVTVGTGRDTVVEAIRMTDGSVLRFSSYRGSWAIPAVAYNGSPGGLSPDGSTLVLTSAARGNPLRKHSAFEVLSTANLRRLARVDLKGDFSFDALSPEGLTLYLIQHVSTRNLNRYVVRAYDLGQDSLLPGRIADRTQRGWVMEGWPLTRATSADGRWAYTLYSRPSGYPFVHALDTVRGVAHCIGIPWTGKQDALWKLRMSLRDGGRTLSLHWRDGREYLAVARGTWRISYPARGHAPGPGFPWWTVSVAGAAVLLAAGILAVGIRRRRLARYDLPARAATSSS